MDSKQLSAAAALLRLSTAGMTLAFSIFIGLGIGWLLKKYLHLGNAAVIGGICLGVVAGFYHMIRDIRVLTQNTREPKKP